jgi:hypothetical protein
MSQMIWTFEIPIELWNLLKAEAKAGENGVNELILTYLRQGLGVERRDGIVMDASGPAGEKFRLETIFVCKKCGSARVRFTSEGVFCVRCEQMDPASGLGVASRDGGIGPDGLDDRQRRLRNALLAGPEHIRMKARYARLVGAATALLETHCCDSGEADYKPRWLDDKTTVCDDCEPLRKLLAEDPATPEECKVAGNSEDRVIAERGLPTDKWLGSQIPGMSGAPANIKPFRPTPSGSELLGGFSSGERIDDAPSGQHFARNRFIGPHLLRDRRGNTAWCGGPGVCSFCERGFPPTADHQAVDIDSIPWAMFDQNRVHIPDESKKPLRRIEERNPNEKATDARRPGQAEASETGDPDRRIQRGDPGGGQSRTDMLGLGYGAAEAGGENQPSNPEADQTLKMICGKCLKPKADHYKDAGGEFWCQGTIGELFDPGVPGYGLAPRSGAFHPDLPKISEAVFDALDTLTGQTNRLTGADPGVLKNATSVTITRLVSIEEARRIGELVRRSAESETPQHYAGGSGPHLLRDRKGNTAYCGGPDQCEFCIKGVPPSGDHQAIQVGDIVMDFITEPVAVEPIEFSVPKEAFEFLDKVKAETERAMGIEPEFFNQRPNDPHAKSVAAHTARGPKFGGPTASTAIPDHVQDLDKKDGES